MKLFRALALIEGLTTLALFFLAMPLKHVFGNPVLVPPIGMAHGIAFIAYLLAMIPALLTSRASLLGWGQTTLAAFFPFGTFLNDRYLRRLQRRRRALGFL